MYYKTRKGAKVKDKKIMDICLLCGGESNIDCEAEHPKWVKEVRVSNILSKEEMASLTQEAKE